MVRQLVVSEPFSGSLVVPGRNNLPRKYRLIELLDLQGNEVIEDGRFESNDFWYLDGGFVIFEQDGYHGGTPDTEPVFPDLYYAADQFDNLNQPNSSYQTYGGLKIESDRGNHNSCSSWLLFSF